MRRSASRRPRALRPAALTAAKMRPYARATSRSTGSGSKVASARCKRSCRRARSAASRVACGPAASSAIVMADTATSSGNSPAEIPSRSIRTDVSIKPRAWRWSGTRRRVLVDEASNVATEPGSSDSRCAGKGGHGCFGRDKHPLAYRGKFPYSNTIACDYEALALVERPHNAPALVAELSLCDLPAHFGSL